MSTKYNSIQINRFINEIIKRWWILFLSTILLGTISYYATMYLLTPVYRTSSTIFIGREGEVQGELTIADLTLSQRLATDYQQLIMTGFVLEEVITRLPAEYRNVNIGPNLRINVVEDSRFLYIIFDDINPARAMLFVNTLSEVLREKSLEVFGVRNMRVVDHAHEPVSPVRPNLLNNTLAGGFLGLLISVLILMLHLVYNDTIKNQEGVEQESGLPVLGIVPKWSGNTSKSKQWNIKTILTSNPLLAESYRVLQANLTYMNLDSKIKVFLFTSALDGEGKTSSVSNLALMLASSGNKVLVIDCDLRKGNIHSVFNLNRVVGLTDYLAQEIKFEKAIKHYSDNELLHILTTGPLPPTSADILTSDTFKNFINEVKSQYDYVLVDAPPVLLFADASFLSMLADAVILVAVTKKTRISDLSKAKYALVKTGARVLGIILTKSETLRKQKYYNYHG